MYDENRVRGCGTGKGLLSALRLSAGFFVHRAWANDRVEKGHILAQIVDPYLGTVVEEMSAPVVGIVFFHASQPIIYSHTSLFRIIPTEET